MRCAASLIAAMSAMGIALASSTHNTVLKSTMGDYMRVRAKMDKLIGYGPHLTSSEMETEIVGRMLQDPRAACDANPDIQCCNYISGIVNACQGVLFSDDDDTSGGDDGGDGDDDNGPDPSVVCPSSCASQLRSAKASIGSNAAAQGVCPMVIFAAVQVDLICTQSSAGTYCFNEINTAFGSLGDASTTQAELQTSVTNACSGGSNSCVNRLGRVFREFFALLGSASFDFDDDSDDDTSSSSSSSGGGPTELLEGVQRSMDLLCLRAGTTYCLPELYGAGLFADDDDDNASGEGQGDDDDDAGPTTAELDEICSPCGRSFISFARDQFDLGGDTTEIISYGCGKRASDNVYCVGPMDSAADAIMSACTREGGSVIDLNIASGSATCNYWCSEAIMAQLATAECCADGALYHTAIHANSNQNWRARQHPNLADYKTRIASVCTNVTTSHFPAACTASTPGEVKVRLTNVKSSFVTGDNRAALESRICADVTTQVGARLDQCSVTNVATSGNTATFTVSLLLESDAASAAAAEQASQLAADGTLDLESSENYLNANADAALADPTAPAGSSASQGDDFPTFDDDGAGRQSQGLVLGAAAALTVAMMAAAGFP